MRNYEKYTETWNKYQANREFGARLKACRELQGKTQEEIAIEILKKRILMETSEISAEDLELYMGVQEGKVRLKDFTPIEGTERVINSVRSNYRDWETKSLNKGDIKFSLNNLRILKSIYHCDYDFLLGDFDLPHRNSKDLAVSLGLSLNTVETLALFTDKYRWKGMPFYSYVLSAIETLIRSRLLLVILIPFFDGHFEHDMFLKMNNIYIQSDEYFSIFKSKIICELHRIADDTIPVSPDQEIKKQDESVIPFGIQLERLMTGKGLSTSALASLIYDYEEKNDLAPPLEESLVRTLNNWKKKTDPDSDVKLSLTDFRALKEVLSCSYEYLFGETEDPSPEESGTMINMELSDQAVKILNEYKADDCFCSVIIDILMTSDRLLYLLTLLFTDIDPSADCCVENDLIDVESDPFARNYFMNWYYYRENEFLKQEDLKYLLSEEIFNELLVIHKEAMDYWSEKM